VVSIRPKLLSLIVGVTFARTVVAFDSLKKSALFTSWPVLPFTTDERGSGRPLSAAALSLAVMAPPTSSLAGLRLANGASSLDPNCLVLPEENGRPTEF